MSQGGKCMIQNITYQVDCMSCLNEGKKTSYIGESSRTGFYRGCDHYKALENRDSKNPIARHWLEEHQGTEWDFRMTIKGVNNPPLMR